ncbi:MAG: hypothetical protein HY751_06885 [Nitrospinae bacterium]|nr:hypothetical protein [Nitrospinota bacterium]
MEEYIFTAPGSGQSIIVKTLEGLFRPFTGSVAEAFYQKSGLVFETMQSLATTDSRDSAELNPETMLKELEILIGLLEGDESMTPPHYGFLPPSGDGAGWLDYARVTLKGKPAELRGGFDKALLTVTVWPNAHRNYDLRELLNIVFDDGVYAVMRKPSLTVWRDELGALTGFLAGAVERNETVTFSISKTG